MKLRRMIAALLAASSLLAGCVVTPDPYYREPVYVEPPPPRVEYPGYPPVVGYIWIGGYWSWTGHRHEWVPGRWDAPRPGHVWIAPRWERDGNHWRQHGGRWEPEHHRPQVMPAPFPAPRFEPRREEPRPLSPEFRRERDNPPMREMPPRREFENRQPPGPAVGTSSAPMPPREMRSEPRPEMRQPTPQPEMQNQAPRDMPRGDVPRGGERKDDRDRSRGRRTPGDDRDR